MLATCPNCRHSYQNELYPACPPCYQGKIHCTKPTSFNPRVNLPPGCNAATKCSINFTGAANDTSLTSKQKQQRVRKFLSGGCVVDGGGGSPDKIREKSGNFRSQKDSNNGGRSPTTPPSFVLPPTSLYASCNAFNVVVEKMSNSFFNSEDDLHRIAASQSVLKKCGWYHEKLPWKSAMELLMPTEVGTFLVRDSSDCKYLYSLSVQTKCGPISIRIHYSKGEFRLDADTNVAGYMPKFPCILELIENYIESTNRLPLECEHEDENQNWINVFGRIYSHVVLTKPLYTKSHIPSLKHLSRLCINRHLRDRSFIDVLRAPSSVKRCLHEYPYKH